MQYEPGERWKYTQCGINAAARIVEVVSGMTFDVFLQQRLFDPLGMKDTTFYPTDAQRARLATAYEKNKETGALEAVPPRPISARATARRRATAACIRPRRDFARFCQMLLNGGTLDGRRYLSAAAMKLLTTSQTGDMPAGFLQTDIYGNRGANYSWGIVIASCARRRRRGSDAVPGHLRPRRRVGHAGVDRSGQGRGLHPHGAALEFPQQRRQRRAPRFSAGGGPGTGNKVTEFTAEGLPVMVT